MILRQHSVKIWLAIQHSVNLIFWKVFYNLPILGADKELFY